MGSAAMDVGVVEDGVVRLAVYDIRGSMVRQLLNEVQPAGRGEVLWDGRDRRGSAVASGIYFYRVEARGLAQTRRLVLLR